MSQWTSPGRIVTGLVSVALLVALGASMTGAQRAQSLGLTRHGQLITVQDAGAGGAVATVAVSPGTAGQVLTVSDAGLPHWAAASGGTGGGTAAAARDALGVQDGPRMIPLFAYATADSATPVVQALAGFTPADYAITGRTTTLTLDAIGSVTGGGLTATLELLNAAGTTVATLTWTETTPTRKTASITLPGSAEIWRARVSCAGVTDPLTDYALLGGAHVRITWS